ncbi:MAG: lysophospholipid acyltransferase family protein [Thermodesulfobacteriota bacterium]|nr:lysophospholipid acyltransferase family protein [Thermodesulfobacteriota bacterium]
MGKKIINLLIVLGLTAGIVAAMILCLFPWAWLPEKKLVRRRAFFFQIWAKAVSRGLGMKVRVRGARPRPFPDKMLLVSNHLSCLDIVVLASVWPVAFVSRHDVVGWPVVGLLARLVGTVFVNRDLRFRSRDTVRELTTALNRGAHLLLFPEGVSTDGQALLPFKTTLFEAPARAGAIIQPMTLRYVSVGDRPLDSETRDIICWYGGTSFIKHVRRLLGLRGIRAEVAFGRMIQPGSPRKVLARQTRQSMAENFRPLLD